MIRGIGTDVVSIPRIEQALGRFGERFVRRILTEAERERFERLGGRVRASHLAKRFAAKEAFSKAIGMGMRWPMTWRACEIVKAPSGQPQIRLHGELADWFAARGLVAQVSVSDESEYAASFVVVETREPAR